MRNFFVVLFLILLTGNESTCQTNEILRSELGQYLGVRSGVLVAKNPVKNRWVLTAGYEGRFSTHFSIPIELLIFRLEDGGPVLHELSTALKFRVPLFGNLTNLYVQGGLSNGMNRGLVLHYAGGVELRLLDSILLVAQAKDFVTVDLGSFVTLGVAINLSSN